MINKQNKPTFNSPFEVEEFLSHINVEHNSFRESNE